MMKLFVCFLVTVLSPAIFAGEDYAKIERDALYRANEYAAEIDLIAKDVTASGKKKEIIQFAKTMSTQVRKEESLVDHLKKVSQVVVFLSFSMPKESLEAWMMQCKKSGATPVIRGLVNNSFRETLEAVHALNEKTQSGLQIDPVLFKTFDITQVPAVVFIQKMDACPANMNCRLPLYDRIYGDVFLDYALEKIYGDSEVHDRKILQEMIGHIRRETT